MKKIKLLSAVIALVMAFSMSAAAIDTLTYDFNEDLPGDHANFTEMGKFWVETLPAVGTCHLVASDDGNALKFSGYSELKTLDVITGEYVFSLDVKVNDHAATTDMANHGIFVRGVMPEHYVKNNNYSGGSDWPIQMNYYESDYYAVWGGTDGTQGLGGAGISVAADDEGLLVTIKAYTDDAMNISSKPTVIPYPDDVFYDQFFNLTFFDNGTDRIDIYLNNKPFALIELSEAGVVYDIDGNVAGDQYFGKAVLKDAYGTELKTVEKTRINSQSSQLAIATREVASEVFVDNIKLVTGEGAVQSIRGDEPVPETKDPNATEKPAEDTNAPAESGAATDAATDAATGADTTEGGEDEKGGNTGLIIGIVVAVVAVIAVVAVVLGKKKK